MVRGLPAGDVRGPTGHALTLKQPSEKPGFSQKPGFWEKPGFSQKPGFWEKPGFSQKPGFWGRLF